MIAPKISGSCSAGPQSRASSLGSSSQPSGSLTVKNLFKPRSSRRSRVIKALAFSMEIPVPLAMRSNPWKAPASLCGRGPLSLLGIWGLVERKRTRFVQPMTALGQEETFSVFGLEVRFRGRSGHHFERLRGLLLAQLRTFVVGKTSFPKPVKQDFLVSFINCKRGSFLPGAACLSRNLSKGPAYFIARTRPI